MNKPLEAGQWCKPKDEKEWKAVLDLAEALGVYVGGQRSRYATYKGVWAHDDNGVCECVLLENDPERNRLSVPDFISGMYALAEKKEKDRATDKPIPLTSDEFEAAGFNGQVASSGREYLATPPRGMRPDMTQERLHALEVKSVLFEDILKRLSAIEEDPLRNRATKLSTGGYAVEKRLVDIIRSAADTDHIYKRLSQLESWRDNVIKANS